MKFIARLQEMASSEILSIIPTDQYLRIKQEDQDPVFRAYVIGHEGDSTGKIVGAGTVVKRWYQSAIRKIQDKLSFGLKIFHNHEMTNDQTGRIPIGEVVGKALKTIKDRLSTIAIAYIKPEYRHLPLDVASIEADVTLNQDPSNDIYEADVEKISAIALGNSAMNQPGFAGATLLSQIQAFADSNKTLSHKFQHMGGGNMTIDKAGIIAFIKAEKIKPSDLFDHEALYSDPAVEGIVEASGKKKISGEYLHRKRESEKFDDEKEEWEKKDKKKDEVIEGLRAENLKIKIPGLLTKIKEERKFDSEKDADLIKYVDTRAKAFKPEDPEKVKEELDKFVDTQVDEFKEIFGKEEGNGKEKTGGEPSEGDEGEENPFLQTIPTDLD